MCHEVLLIDLGKLPKVLTVPTGFKYSGFLFTRVGRLLEFDICKVSENK